jgi:WD40 repeat protein
MPNPSADRNLLFGILALQMDFIGRDDLIAAMNAWVIDKTKTLGDILRDMNKLAEDERGLLDGLVRKHLERHGGDPQQSLAALGSLHSVCQDLQQVADADVQASLAHVSAAQPAPDADATRADLSSPAAHRFRVLRPHARGGLGEVFVAQDEELEREVALKEIQERHAGNAESRARFLLEAKVTGGLEHPGIVPVYGLGTYGDGRPFYAMRFIKGDSLKDAIARFHAEKDRLTPGERTLRLRQLLGRFLDVCHAIEYAHSRGVLHRDLKPGNILVGKYGETLVVDWGLAKVLDRADVEASESALPNPLGDDSALTQAGTALGTPAYMSPEQAAGRLDQMGPRSDVYGLGATLYCMLTGRAPIGGKDTAEVLRKAQCGERLPPRRVTLDVPPALDAICCKAMALRPGQRYATALELAADVERWLADQPVSAWPEPWAVRGRRWLGRHRTLLATVAASILVATLGLAVATALLVSANEELEAANGRERSAKGQEQTARSLAEQREREAREQSYAAHLGLVQRAWDDADVTRVRELLASQDPAQTGGLDLRGFEWHYFDRLNRGALFSLEGHTVGVDGVAFSPDGKLLASAGGGGLKLWDMRTGQEVPTFQQRANRVSFSPDGKLLACAEGRHLTVRDMVTGQSMFSWKAATGDISTLAFSRDGKQLAAAGYEAAQRERTTGYIRVWELSTRRDVCTVSGQPHEITSVAFSPDGKRLASASRGKASVLLIGALGPVSAGPGELRIWGLANGKALLDLRGHLLTVQSVTFSPDGRTLGSAGDDGTVRLWDAATGQQVSSFAGHKGEVACVVFSPDGRRLASAGVDKTIRIWDVARGRCSLLKGHIDPVRCLAFSPDGRRLAAGGGHYGADLAPSTSGGTEKPASLKVWDVTHDQDTMVLPRVFPQVCCAAFSPDGRLVASGYKVKGVAVWDAATGQQLHFLNHNPLEVAKDLAQAGATAVTFKAGGTELASIDHFGGVRIWQLGAQPRARGFLIAGSGNGSLVASAFSPDGKRVAVAWDNGAVKVVEVGTGKVPFSDDEHVRARPAVAFSSDGLRLAVARLAHGEQDQTNIKIWDLATGRVVVALAQRGDVMSVAISPDGRWLSAAGAEGQVRVWDLASGQAAFVLKGHTGFVGCVAFSPDGRRLASGSYDRTVRLWDLVTGQEMLTLRGHPNALSCVAFSPDGNRLVSTCSFEGWDTPGEPGEARIWDATPRVKLLEEGVVRKLR